jgi:hypothetical protein
MIVTGACGGNSSDFLGVVDTVVGTEDVVTIVDVAKVVDVVNTVGAADFATELK